MWIMAKSLGIAKSSVGDFKDLEDKIDNNSRSRAFENGGHFMFRENEQIDENGRTIMERSVCNGSSGSIPVYSGSNPLNGGSEYITFKNTEKLHFTENLNSCIEEAGKNISTIINVHSEKQNGQRNLNHFTKFTGLKDNTQMQGLSKSKNFRLFVLHNNSLKPIIYPEVKSGIYRPPHGIATKNITESVDKEVVYITAEKHGKIVPVDVFNKVYRNSDSGDSEISGNNSHHSVIINKLDTKHKRRNCSNNHSANSVLKMPLSRTFHLPKCKNAVIYHNKAINKKFTYRMVRPEEFNLHTPLSKTATNKIKLVMVVNGDTEAQLPIITPIKPARGRPKKNQRKINTDNEYQQNNQISLVARTRCGRLSVPPKHIHGILKKNENCDEPVATATTKELKSNTQQNCNEENVDILKILPKRERNIPPEYRCNVCNKIVLGRIRMIKHAEACSERIQKAKTKDVSNNMSLYEYLTEKVQTHPGSDDEKVEKFLSELTDFVNQIQARSSNLVQDTSRLYFINSKVAKILGVHEGHFGVNIDAFNMSINLKENIEETSTLIPPPQPRLEYNLSISLDDTIQDAKLHLPDNIITSDDSLLRTVDDLVKEKMKSLNSDDSVINNVQSSSVIHYDHASDNAVEAVNIKESHPPLLDLSLDLFQFNSN